MIESIFEGRGSEQEANVNHFYDVLLELGACPELDCDSIRHVVLMDGDQVPETIQQANFTIKLHPIGRLMTESIHVNKPKINNKNGAAPTTNGVYTNGRHNNHQSAEAKPTTESGHVPVCPPANNGHANTNGAPVNFLSNGNGVLNGNGVTNGTTNGSAHSKNGHCNGHAKSDCETSDASFQNGNVELEEEEEEEEGEEELIDADTPCALFFTSVSMKKTISEFRIK